MPGVGREVWETACRWRTDSSTEISHSLDFPLLSIDLVDMAFNYMDIEDETCRMKTICQAENYAVQHPVARLAINTLK